MGRFDEYLTGKLELEVGGEKLELDVKLGDKRKFKGMANKDGTTEETLKKIDDCIIEILHRSYPEDSKESLEAFYAKNDVTFLNELLIAFGWLKREDLDKTKKD